MFNVIKRVLTLPILCSVLLSVPTGKAVAQTLNIYTEQMPPFNFKSADNKVEGINIDLLKAVLDAENIRYNIELYPWSRAYKLVQRDRRGGIISTVKMPSRLDKFKWVGPFVSIRNGADLYRLTTRTDIKINSSEDLKHYITGYVRGGVYEDMLRNKGLDDKHLFGFPSSTDYYKMLFNNKLDLVVGTENTIKAALAVQGYPSAHVTKVYSLEDIGGIYLALNLKVPNRLVKKLNRRLLKIKESEQLTTIIERYTTLDKVR